MAYQVVAEVDAVLQPGVDCFGHFVFAAHFPAVGDGDGDAGEEVGEGAERVEGVLEHGEGERSLGGLKSVGVARGLCYLCVCCVGGVCEPWKSRTPPSALVFLPLHCAAVDALADVAAAAAAAALV